MRVEEVTLHGNWVTLEPLRPSHADELFPDAMEPELFRFIAPGAEQSKAALRSWILARIEEQAHGTALPFLQRDAVTKKAFGATCMTNVSTQHHRGEISHTWLAKSHRKTPANTEGKLLVLTHAFETLGCVRIQFKVDCRNESAQVALERIGAVQEGRMRNERILNDGFVRDAFVYSIIDREWPEVKRRLNGLLWSRTTVEPAVPLKPAPPPIPGLETSLRPPASAWSKLVRPTPSSGAASAATSTGRGPSVASGGASASSVGAGPSTASQIGAATPSLPYGRPSTGRSSTSPAPSRSSETEDDRGEPKGSRHPRSRSAPVKSERPVRKP